MLDRARLEKLSLFFDVHQFIPHQPNGTTVVIETINDGLRNHIGEMDED
jgi:hypothetical protein